MLSNRSTELQLPILKTSKGKLETEKISQRALSFDTKPQEKIVTYIERKENYYRKHKLNFNDPLVIQAAQRIGLKYENCVLKYYD